MINQRLTKLLGIRSRDTRQIHLGGPVSVQVKGHEVWVRIDTRFDGSARDMQERLWTRLGIIAGIGGDPVKDETGRYWQPFLVVGFSEAQAPRPDQESKFDGLEGNK